MVGYNSEELHVLQLILMPLLAPTIGEERLLNIGLLASCTHVTISDWNFHYCLNLLVKSINESLYLKSFSKFCRYFFTALHGHLGYLSLWLSSLIILLIFNLSWINIVVLRYYICHTPALFYFAFYRWSLLRSSCRSLILLLRSWSWVFLFIHV